VNHKYLRKFEVTIDLSRRLLEHEKLPISFLFQKHTSNPSQSLSRAKPASHCQIGCYRDLDVTVALFRRLCPAISIVAPHERLSLISRHLDLKPPLPLNTPFSIERTLSIDPPAAQSRPFSTSPTPKMSTQPEHPTLLIPGPIEFDDAVLQSMGHFRLVSNLVAFLQSLPILMRS
jgi:hypothetical protein